MIQRALKHLALTLCPPSCTSNPVTNGHLADLALAFHGPLETNEGQKTTRKGECRVDQRYLSTSKRSGLIREHLLQTGVDQKD